MNNKIEFNEEYLTAGILLYSNTFCSPNQAVKRVHKVNFVLRLQTLLLTVSFPKREISIFRVIILRVFSSVIGARNRFPRISYFIGSILLIRTKSVFLPGLNSDCAPYSVITNIHQPSEFVQLKKGETREASRVFSSLHVRKQENLRAFPWSE